MEITKEKLLKIIKDEFEDIEIYFGEDLRSANGSCDWLTSEDFIKIFNRLIELNVNKINIPKNFF